MAFRVTVTPSAIADLVEYADYIALDSSSASKNWLRQAREAMMSLRTNPERFAIIPEAEDIGAELRDFMHYSHRVIYQIKKILMLWRFFASGMEPDAT